MLLFGSQEKGDLLKIGYLIDNTYNYRNIFSKAFSEEIQYTNISDIKLETDFDILTIGDSFSQQAGHGYQNYLVKNGLKILHVDYSGNSIQLLYNLINGDIFDSLNIKYVLIQSVERDITRYASNIDTSTILYLKDYKSNLSAKEQNQNSYKFFSSRVIKFPFINLLYLIDDNAFLSKVYKVKTCKDLFSTGNKNLLFYYKDIDNLSYNNQKNQVNLLNNVLNTLSKILTERNIKLIVLPSPDKYDIFYDYINNKSKYPKPLFFEYLSVCEKDYIYIDAKELFNDTVKNNKDIYFYDDSHWSPTASLIIANKISELIEKQ